MPESTARSGRTWQLWLALYVACSMVVGLVVSLLVLRSGVGTTDVVLAGEAASRPPSPCASHCPRPCANSNDRADPDRLSARLSPVNGDPQATDAAKSATAFRNGSAAAPVPPQVLLQVLGNTKASGC